jgi:hypothetical protein
VRKTGSDTQLLRHFSSVNRLKTRVDADGTLTVPGKSGHIYTYDDGVLGVMVMPDPPRTRYCAHIRRAMLQGGFVVVQVGDGDGAATFEPTNPQQAELAIRAAGIKKRRISPEQREKQIARLRASAGRALLAPGTNVGAVAYIAAHPRQEGRLSGLPATNQAANGGVR